MARKPNMSTTKVAKASPDRLFAAVRCARPLFRAKPRFFTPLSPLSPHPRRAQCNAALRPAASARRRFRAISPSRPAGLGRHDQFIWNTFGGGDVRGQCCRLAKYRVTLEQVEQRTTAVRAFGGDRRCLHNDNFLIQIIAGAAGGKFGRRTRTSASARSAIRSAAVSAAALAAPSCSPSFRPSRALAASIWDALGQAVGGGVSGAVVTAIVGLIKSQLAAKAGPAARRAMRPGQRAARRQARPRRLFAGFDPAPLARDEFLRRRVEVRRGD